MRKVLGLAMVVALSLTALVAVPAAADTKYTCPQHDFHGDVELTGPAATCVITTAIDGNVTSEGRSVTVGNGGSVDGYVEVRNGHIQIWGSVNGNVKQERWGWLRIGGSVDGNAEEFGNGGVRVYKNADINGNVGEYGRHDCIVHALADVNGNLEGGC